MLHDPPVDAVSKHGLDDLTQDGHYAASQPLVGLQVKDLVHHQKHDAQRNVIFILSHMAGTFTSEHKTEDAITSEAAHQNTFFPK